MRRWIKLGVVPSFIPIILVVLYDIYLGYNIKNIINRHLLDFLLIIFAIAVSVFSSAMILYKNIKSNNNSEKAENHIMVAMAIGLFCSVFFTLLYDRIKQDDNLTVRKILFCIVQIVITVFLIYKGMQTEAGLESQTTSSLNTNNAQP